LQDTRPPPPPSLHTQRRASDRKVGIQRDPAARAALLATLARAQAQRAAPVDSTLPSSAEQGSGMVHHGRAKRSRRVVLPLWASPCVSSRDVRCEKKEVCLCQPWLPVFEWVPCPDLRLQSDPEGRLHPQLEMQLARTVFPGVRMDYSASVSPLPPPGTAEILTAVQGFVESEARQRFGRAWPVS
jgi:hypothetical protein